MSEHEQPISLQLLREQHATLERIERSALRGAANDPAPDKTDWIRIWAVARSARGQPTGAADWIISFAASQANDRPSERTPG